MGTFSDSQPPKGPDPLHNPPATFDSRPDTWEHIGQVQGLVLGVAQELVRRAWKHDQSKLSEPERSAFDEVTPKLAATTYPSPEYDEAKAELGKALGHHYRHNDHHPEHFEAGIHDMDLIQLLEMLCDWKAAGRRHKDGGDLRRSIETGAERFGYGPELKRILLNTVDAVERAELE